MLLRLLASSGRDCHNFVVPTRANCLDVVVHAAKDGTRGAASGWCGGGRRPAARGAVKWEDLPALLTHEAG